MHDILSRPFTTDRISQTKLFSWKNWEQNFLMKNSNNMKLKFLNFADININILIKFIFSYT